MAPQFNSLQMWKEGIGSHIWIVLASGLCPEVTNITSRWNHWIADANFSSVMMIVKAHLERISTRLNKPEFLGQHSEQLP